MVSHTLNNSSRKFGPPLKIQIKHNSCQGILKILVLVQIYNITWTACKYNSFWSKLLVWVKFETLAIYGWASNVGSNCPYIPIIWIMIWRTEVNFCKTFFKPDILRRNIQIDNFNSLFLFQIDQEDKIFLCSNYGTLHHQNWRKNFKNNYFT